MPLLPAAVKKWGKQKGPKLSKLVEDDLVKTSNTLGGRLMFCQEFLNLRDAARDWQNTGEFRLPGLDRDKVMNLFGHCSSKERAILWASFGEMLFEFVA